MTGGLVLCPGSSLSTGSSVSNCFCFRIGARLHSMREKHAIVEEAGPRSLRIHSLRKKPNPRPSADQVHHTARSVLSDYPAIQTTRPSIHSESTPLVPFWAQLQCFRKKLDSFERAQLRLCRKNCGTSPALAAVGWFCSPQYFFASCSVVPRMAQNQPGVSPQGLSSTDRFAEILKELQRKDTMSESKPCITS